jgi:hypothetical protein
MMKEESAGNGILIVQKCKAAVSPLQALDTIIVSQNLLAASIRVSLVTV